VPTASQPARKLNPDRPGHRPPDRPHAAAPRRHARGDSESAKKLGNTKSPVCALIRTGFVVAAGAAGSPVKVCTWSDPLGATTRRARSAKPRPRYAWERRKSTWDERRRPAVRRTRRLCARIFTAWVEASHRAGAIVEGNSGPRCLMTTRRRQPARWPSCRSGFRETSTGFRSQRRDRARRRA